MALLGDTVSKFTGGIHLVGVGKGIAIILVFVVVLLIIGAIGFFIIQNRRYNRNITDIEYIPGVGSRVINRDKAMLVKVGDHGEELLRLRRKIGGKTMFRNAYGQRLDAKTYLFARSKNGDMHNVIMGDVDATLRSINIEPTSAAMKLQASGIRKNIKAEFEKKESWLKQNAALLLGIGFVVIILVFMWLLADKYLTIGTTANKSMEISSGVLDRISELLGKMDNICAGGSGVQKVAAV